MKKRNLSQALGCSMNPESIVAMIMRSKEKCKSTKGGAERETRIGKPILRSNA